MASFVRLFKQRHLADARSGSARFLAELHVGATVVSLGRYPAPSGGQLYDCDAVGRNKKLDAFFDNWLVIFLNVPALVTIILCYVWFGLVESAAILAVVINKLPNVIVTIREGTRTLDQDLLDMARCYHFGKRKTLVHVIWPQLHPFVMGATRSGLALIWKIILVVELLGRSNGMGYQLHLFFQLFDVASILAYTIAFVAVIQMIELLILKPLDKKALRWRR